MAKRFTDTELWDKEWFMLLSCKLKCLVKLVRDKCDLSGVWSPNWKLACDYIGEKVTAAELIAIDEGKQFLMLENGKILCIGFIEFQYGVLSEKSPVHRKVLSVYSSHGLKYDKNQIGYQYPIDRVSNSLQEEEEDKDKEKEEDEEKEKSGFFLNELDKNLEIDENQVLKTVEYIQLTIYKQIQPNEVKNYWKAFKIQNFDKKEFQRNMAALYSHFRDFVKYKVQNSKTEPAKPSQLQPTKNISKKLNEIYGKEPK